MCCSWLLSRHCNLIICWDWYSTRPVLEEKFVLHPKQIVVKAFVFALMGYQWLKHGSAYLHFAILACWQRQNRVDAITLIHVEMHKKMKQMYNAPGFCQTSVLYCIFWNSLECFYDGTRDWRLGRCLWGSSWLIVVKTGPWASVMVTDRSGDLIVLLCSCAFGVKWLNKVCACV